VPLRVATYNAGLAVGVLPLVTERLPHVIDALSALEVDVLFVQELWLDAHWDALATRLASRFPHAVRPPVDARIAGGCREEEVAPLVLCANAHCRGLRDEALAQCVVTHCASVALAMPSRCTNCIATHPSGTLDEIVSRCLRPPELLLHADDGPSGLMAYGGSFGTGLLSRLPLHDVSFFTYRSTVNARGAIHARIEHEELGDVHVVATHFSPGGAEQGPQVEELVAFLRQRVAGAPAVLLGDLNTTSGSSLFRLLEAEGLREPDELDTRGTYSASGLGTGRISASSWRIDHVLTRALGHVRSERVLDEAVLVTAAGRPVMTTLSDHFGVRAVIERR
jgi:endonuclease/exonuclease/phosphatase family metal-dependent hydrolase